MTAPVILDISPTIEATLKSVGNKSRTRAYKDSQRMSKNRGATAEAYSNVAITRGGGLWSWTDIITCNEGVSDDD